MKHFEVLWYTLKKQIIYILAFAGWAGFAFSCIFIWFVAYFNGGAVGLTINSYREANVELVMILLLTPFFIVSAIALFRHFKREVRAIRRRWYKRQGLPVPLVDL